VDLVEKQFSESRTEMFDRDPGRGSVPALTGAVIEPTIMGIRTGPGEPVTIQMVYSSPEMGLRRTDTSGMGVVVSKAVG